MGPATPAATPSSSTRRSAPCTPATCFRGRTPRWAIAATAGAAGRRHGLDEQVPGLRLHPPAGGRAGHLRRAERQV